MATNVISNSPGCKLIAGIISTDASGDVSSFHIPGASAATKDSTGAYKVTLADPCQHVLAIVASTSTENVTYKYFASSGLGGDAPYVILYTYSRSPSVSGGLVSDPTTPSAQLTGTGDTTWNVNIAATLASNSQAGVEPAASEDFEIHGGSELVADGESCIAAIVVDYNGGSPTFAAIKGAAATTGEEVAPTDAEITTALGDGYWVRLAHCTINRTGDTTVTQSQDNSVCMATSASLKNKLANVVSGNINVIIAVSQ